MTVEYILAPDPLWSALKQTGVPAANGYVFTFVSGTRTYAPTYLDPAGLNAQTNPIRLNSAGEAVIYWKVGDGLPLYTIEIYAASDVDGIPGQLIYTTDNYPTTVNASGGGSVITIYSNNTNNIRNEQFTWWTHGDTFATADLPAADTPIADEWYFRRGNTNANISITRQTFAPGANPPPGNPVYYLEYECTSAATDSVNVIFEKFDSVQTLANQQVTVGFWAKTRDLTSASTVDIYIEQFFGAGGSATPAATTYTKTITDEWRYYSETFTVPTVVGKTIGTGGDDYLLIGLQPQINQVIAIDITNVALQKGTGTGTNFPFRSPNDQYTNILPGILNGSSDEEGTNVVRYSATQTLNQFLRALQQGNFLIGWDFALNPNQLGQTINSVVNGTYIADQTILVSDGNSIVHKNSFVGMPLTLQVATASKKFGIFQIIETSNCADLREKAVSLAASLTADSEITCKMAILKWSGTQDQQLRACVSAWNTPGTNPSLATGWSYVGTPASFTAGTSEVFATLENVTLDSSSSFGVLIWNDSADLPIGEYLRFHKASLTLGETAFQPIPSDAESVLAQCQRYYQRSYDWSQVLVSGAVTNTASESVTPQSYWSSGGGGSATGSFYPSTSFTGPLKLSAQYYRIRFQTPMFKAPAVALYNPFTGASGNGKVPLELSSGSISSGSETISITAIDANTNGFLLSSPYTELDMSGAVISTTPQLYFHFTANAQLGV